MRREARGVISALSPRRRSIATWLGVLVFLPAVTVVSLAGSDAFVAWERAHESRVAHDEATRLHDVVGGRAAISDEFVYSGTLVYASQLGLDASALRQTYGIDFEAGLAAARKRVDAAIPFLSEDRSISLQVTRLQGFRPRVDSRATDFDEVRSEFAHITDQIDALWEEALHALHDTGERSATRGIIASSDSLHFAYSAFRSSFEVVQQAVAVASGDPRADVSVLISARARYADAIEEATGRMGPRADRALAKLVGDPATVRFDSVTEGAVASALRREPSPFVTDPGSFGEAFFDSFRWVELLTEYVEAAALDLRDAANLGEEAARSDLRAGAAITLAISLVTIVGGLAVARSLAQPINGLAAAARNVTRGRLVIDKLPASGPRELNETAEAVNDMAAALRAVERYAIELSEDPTSSALDSPLPGRTGEALQVAVDKLRASMQAGERHRRDLAHLATHDGLTGLLRRDATLEAVGRYLAYAARNAKQVAALFVDLDGLKALNDAYGHRAGDAALRVTAAALSEGSRRADIIGRIGGDEFLVAGLADSTDIRAMAGRVVTDVGARWIVVEGLEVPLRCSVGGALSVEGDDVTSLLARADAALYESKRSGRNRAFVAPTPDSGSSGGSGGVADKELSPLHQGR